MYVPRATIDDRYCYKPHRFFQYTLSLSYTQASATVPAGLECHSYLQSTLPTNTPASPGQDHSRKLAEMFFRGTIMPLSRSLLIRRFRFKALASLWRSTQGHCGGILSAPPIGQHRQAKERIGWGRPSSPLHPTLELTLLIQHLPFKACHSVQVTH